MINFSSSQKFKMRMLFRGYLRKNFFFFFHPLDGCNVPEKALDADQIRFTRQFPGIIRLFYY